MKHLFTIICLLSLATAYTWAQTPPDPIVIGNVVEVSDTTYDAIKKAIAKVNELKTGDPDKPIALYFPAGIYRFDAGDVYQSKDIEDDWIPGNVMVKGDGAGSTVLRRIERTDRHGLIRIKTGSENVTITGIEFQFEIGMRYFRYNETQDELVEDTTSNVSDNFASIILARGATNLRITDCTFHTGWSEFPDIPNFSVTTNDDGDTIKTYPIRLASYDAVSGTTIFGDVSPLKFGGTQQEIDAWKAIFEPTPPDTYTEVVWPSQPDPPRFIYHNFGGNDPYNTPGASDTNQEFYQSFFRKQPTLKAIFAEDGKQIWIADNVFNGLQAIIGIRNDAGDRYAGPGLFFINNTSQSPHNYLVSCMTKPLSQSGTSGSKVQYITGVRISNNYVHGLGMTSGAIYLGLDNDHAYYSVNPDAEAVCNYIQVCNNTIVGDWLSVGDASNIIGIYGRVTKRAKGWIVSGNNIDNQSGTISSRHNGILLKIVEEIKPETVDGETVYVPDGFVRELTAAIVSDNSIANLGKMGIWANGEYVIVANNHIKGGDYGLRLGASDAIVRSNTITGSGRGITVGADAKPPTVDSKLLAIANRTINVGTGIDITASSSAQSKLQFFSNCLDGTGTTHYGINLTIPTGLSTDPFEMIVHDNVFEDFHADTYSHDPDDPNSALFKSYLGGTNDSLIEMP